MSGAADALEPRELGTLIVVVGKARNLPNKSRFGKQDPFCTVRLQEEKQRTKAIKRGGQHPEWDEELRFTVKEDLDEVIARSDSSADTSLSSSTSQSNVPTKDGSVSGVTTAAALACRSRKGPIAKNAGKKLNVSCYADDAKEPELIGECAVLIDEVLKKGEVDEWYEFTYKDKYSGEVYLELTFYSNEAPPVKRNPRIQQYGQASLVGSSASLSSASRPSMASLSTSSSVSGMNLYIPPYAQPAREPSPAPSASTTMHNVAPSNSFAQLGLPSSHSHHRNQSLPSLHGQPGYPPSLSSMASISTLQPIPSDPMDALTRPMSSMSISSSLSQRPLPSATPRPAQQQQQSGPSYPPTHRHSLGEAPWSGLLPQSQPPPAAPTPQPRPMSTNDTASMNQYQWEQIRQNAATPLARPTSAYAPPTQYNNGSYADPRAPSPIPTTLLPGHPPQKHHAHSFSGLSGQPHPSTYLNPAPTPPPASHSAPPANYPPPQPSYPPQADPYRSATPMNPYRTSTPQPDIYAGAQTPRPQEYADQRYNAVLQQHPYDQSQTPYPGAYPTQPSGHFPPSTSASSNWSQSQPTPPRRQSSTPAPQPNSSGYVPWYQQTQPAPQQQYQPTPTPPPVPDYNRPAPGPPPPPRSSMGYYPSDELYALQRQDQQSDQIPWQQQQQQQQQAHDPYRQTSPAPSSYTQQSYNSSHPGYTETPPRAPTGWQSTVPQSYNPAPPQQPYIPPSSPYQPLPPPRSPSPAPPPRAPEGWQSQLGPPPSQAQAQGTRTPSPAPPAAPGIKHDWKSYMQSLNAAGGRVSPQPPPSQQQGQEQWYTPPPSLPSSIRPPDGWNSGMHVSQDGHQWRG